MLVGVVSFFRWPSDVTGATVRSSSCVVPESGMEIIKDTLLCTGTYLLEQPLSLQGDQTLLDCNGAVLMGEGGTGILADGHDLIIKDCVIKSFDEGVVLMPAALVAFEGVSYADNGKDVVRH